jgi:ABC-type sugar transport system, periplasmic component
MKLKRLVSLALMGAIAISAFTGCAGKTTDTGSQGQSKPSGQTVTLRIWGGVPPEAGPQKSIDDFNAAFKDKGIQAEYERFVNDDTGNLKLETSLLSGDDVDVYITYSASTLTKRASGNMALDLSDLIKRDNFDIEGTFGAVAKSYYINGKPYSIPSKIDQYGIVINKNMFDAAGIPIPTDWTFDEFREIAKKLTKGEGQDKVYGMFWNSQQDLMYPIDYLSAQTLGGDPLYKAGGKEANITDPINVKSIELINNMMNVDKSSPTHTDSVTQKLSQEGMFLTGKAAMTVGPWMVRSIKDAKQYPHDFVTAFAPYPVAEKDQRKYTQGGYGDLLCINPKSQNVDAAWEYVKWYATKGMLPVTEGGRVPAASTYKPDEVTSAFLSGAEKLFDADSTKKILITRADNYAVPSVTTKLPEIRKILQEELENIYIGKETVQAGMENAQKRANEQLQTAG